MASYSTATFSFAPTTIATPSRAHGQPPSQPAPARNGLGSLPTSLEAAQKRITALEDEVRGFRQMLQSILGLLNPGQVAQLRQQFPNFATSGNIGPPQPALFSAVQALALPQQPQMQLGNDEDAAGEEDDDDEEGESDDEPAGHNGRGDAANGGDEFDDPDFLPNFDHDDEASSPESTAFPGGASESLPAELLPYGQNASVFSHKPLPPGITYPPDMAYPPEGLRFQLTAVKTPKGRTSIGGGGRGANQVLNEWTKYHGYKVITRRTKVKRGRNFLTMVCARFGKSKVVVDETGTAKTAKGRTAMQNYKPDTEKCECPFQFKLKEVDRDSMLFEVSYFKVGGGAQPHNHGPNLRLLGGADVT